MSAEPRIRPATPEDVESLAVMLADAFKRDASLEWVLPEPAGRDDFMVAMFRHRITGALQSDEMLVDVTEDLSGAAIWQSPRVRQSDYPPPTVGTRIIAGFRAIYAARPAEPHWYLHGIGARPAGRGVGSALMRVALQRRDRDGVASALWTGDEGNLALHGKHGYRVLKRIDVGGAAAAWWMWRDAGEVGPPDPERP